MSKFSDFNRFGHLRFSNRKPTGRVLYEDMVRNSGGETNISTSFNDSPVNAELYAEAMQLARAKDSGVAAGEQFIPLRAVPMLPKLEWEHGIIPGPNDSIRTRQRAVAAAAKIARGARRENVEAVLRDLLGADFVAIIPTEKGLLVETAADPLAVGIWKIPGAQKRVYQITPSIPFMGVPITVAITYVAGEPGGFQTGEKVVLDVGDSNRTETVLVNNGTPTSFQATFTKPHNPGTLATSGRVPNLGSTKRHNLVLLSETAIRDAEKRRIANRALKKLLRGVSTWSLGGPTDGVTGPFTVGVGRLGVTPIGAF